MLRRYALQGTLSSTRGALALDVERYSHELFLDRIWQLRDNVSTYDAVSVSLAEALGAVLVTGDSRLLGAPGLTTRIERA